MSMRLRRLVPVALTFALLAATPVAGQDNVAPIPVPFGVGERLEYDVKFGKLRVGSGSMEVADVQEVRGRSSWHTIFQVRGGTFFYRVNDQYESWIDRHSGNSLRFKQDLNEGRRDVERAFEIFPERAAFLENGVDTLQTSVKNPLDDGSFLYFLRTIPLAVGETYVFERYFRPDRNPVTIKVLRKERIEVPAGQFDAIVVQPVIKTSGIFSENGHAEIWLSDDENRIMLQMKSGLSFGSLNLYLKSYRPAQAGATVARP
ncbi:MAG: DUF3108 domain-containing protein [Gemmatimonadaceae bacterium]|nr:DUF3108 domain-containing protein [Gemmatimonadaceae bacterium]NUO94814.1 DUF3108 domain-containing protein [Gemmatimonadaceae bacterium]NUP72890.1 DUF3108 domain-containing protein [Gemmatimonadaceae bacterium]NUR35646.1 DUF3108 domain-containing protein [Gemmatimonadaceae bacterium]NUS33371.1 DUF3108 domain-containing protein [Gemmatimonadaceae bacterium]